jgi:NTE family protein
MLGRVSSLLDTQPLLKHCAKTLDRKRLAENIAQGSIAGVGLVATTCPADGTGGRSHVFLQAGARIPRPESDPTSALDYLDVELTHRHILASAAIPLAFPPVGVPGESGGIGYYTDGGVRLNTPIAPALDLDATRLVIVSSHATAYPKGGCFNEKPDVIDIAAQSVHSILADGMIEDLRTLRRINSIVSQSAVPIRDETARSRRPFRLVPHIAVAPNPGQLAQLAHDFRARFTLNPKRLYRKLEYGFVRSLFAGFGTGVGNDELLSYLLFNPDFAAQQIELGKQHARKALQDKQLPIRAAVSG